MDGTSTLQPAWVTGKRNKLCLHICWHKGTDPVALCVTQQNTVCPDWYKVSLLDLNEGGGGLARTGSCLDKAWGNGLRVTRWRRAELSRVGREESSERKGQSGRDLDAL